MTPQPAARQGVKETYELLLRAAARGLPMAPEGVGDWRCLAVEKLSQVELSAETWRTQQRSGRQTCIDEVDFDVDSQLEEDPQ
jgi:hypothetical protein